jgi:hypothetical protein
MGKTTQKNFRLSKEVIHILDEVVAATGSNDTRITELALTLYAQEIGVEINRAKQFLYDNLSARVAAHRMHQPRLPAPKPHPVKTKG